MDPQNYLFSKPLPNSFSRLDETRVVTTPRSLIACELEGVDPEELLHTSGSPTRRKFPPGSIEHQKSKFEEEFQERERRKLVELVKNRWTMLSHPSSRVGSAKAHPPPSKNHSPRKPGTNSTADGISSSTRKWVAGLEKDIAAEAAQAIDADITVAKQFLRLKASIEAATSARATLEEREAAARSRYDALMNSRKEQAEEQARKFEARHLRVLSSRQEQLEEKKGRHEERLDQLQQRLEAADRQVAELKLTKSSKASTRSGEEERLAVEKAKREKTEALESKLEAANQAAVERRRMRELSDEMKQFHMSLKRKAMDRTQERAKKVQAYRQQQIRERENEDLAQDAERTKERVQESKARHAAREIIAHQRDAVRSYIEACAVDGADEVRVPDWLAPRVDLFERQTKGRKAHTPRPPQDPSSTHRTKKQRSHSSQREAVSPPREKFSVQSPRISERQVFSKWMYE